MGLLEMHHPLVPCFVEAMVAMVVVTVVVVVVVAVIVEPTEVMMGVVQLLLPLLVFAQSKEERVHNHPTSLLLPTGGVSLPSLSTVVAANGSGQRNTWLHLVLSEPFP